MRFDKAFKIMKQGSKVKLPSWGGYWFWSKEKQTIIMHTKDGERMVISKSCRECDWYHRPRITLGSTPD